MLTLVIPTKNRPLFISRALQYYASAACKIPIIIGDSSDEKNFSQARRWIETAASGLNVHHIRYSQSGSDRAKGWQQDRSIIELLNQVETPYAAFYADDDFAVANNLALAVDFLEANRDYSFVSGCAAAFSLEGGGVYGQIDTAWQYHQRTIDDADPARRLLSLFRDYPGVEYGVSRTNQLKHRWNKVFEAHVDNHTGEIVNGSLVVLQGKTKKLEHLFLVRQIHSQQTSNDMFDWVSNDLFPHNYHTFQEVIGRELSLQDGMSVDSAQEVVKEAFWFYLARNLLRKWQSRYAVDGRSVSYRFRELARSIPGVRRAWHMMRSVFPDENSEFSLEALLRPSSPYHNDFMPIYRAVTAPPPASDETGPE